jgi:hypothetical protein
MEQPAPIGNADEHPIYFDPRGKAVPRIMYLKRSWVDAKYQYDPSAPADESGGILMPDIRRVRKLNK